MQFCGSYVVVLCDTGGLWAGFGFLMFVLMFNREVYLDSVLCVMVWLDNVVVLWWWWCVIQVSFCCLS